MRRVQDSNGPKSRQEIQNSNPQYWHRAVLDARLRGYDTLGY